MPAEGQAALGALAHLKVRRIRRKMKHVLRHAMLHLKINVAKRHAVIGRAKKCLGFEATPGKSARAGEGVIGVL